MSKPHFCILSAKCLLILSKFMKITIVKKNVLIEIDFLIKNY